MKKISFLIFCFGICLALTAGGQKLSKQEAKELLETTRTCLINSDTSTFVKQWYLNDSTWPYHQATFDEEQLKEHFAELKKFLDTALTRNLKLVNIEIEEQDKNDKKNYWAQYKIRGWFDYDKSYRKGIAFNVDFFRGKWYYRFEPDYSSMTHR